MAQKPGPGKCVHCLEHAEYRNWDHVFPKGWYPTSTPDDIEKWKIPTCKSCNDYYGRIESELGILLSLCVDPDTAESAGIYEKTLRALDATKGKTRKDAIARAKKRDEILAALVSGNDVPKESIYPGLDDRWGQKEQDQRAISIPADSLTKLVEKIIKGITFLESGRYLDEEIELEHLVVDEHGASQIIELIEKYGETHSRGPGIEIKRVVTPEDGISALYKIVIWGEVVMYASAIQKPA